MKEEKEVKLLTYLFNGVKFNNILFSSYRGSKSDFEKILNISSNNNEFLKWFKELLKKDIIKFFEYRENSRGSPTKIYLIKKQPLLKYMKGFEFYSKFKNIIIMNDL